MQFRRSWGNPGRTWSAHINLDASNLPRLYKDCEWADENTVYVYVCFGAPSSDPVVALDFNITLPEWLASRLP